MTERIIDAYRSAYDPAHIFTVPKLTEDDPEVTISIEAFGGGTPGKAYAGNDWFYEVRMDGEFIMDGGDLHHALPATAEDMARVLADFLSADAESPGALEGYDDAERAFLESQGERLGMWANERNE